MNIRAVTNQKGGVGKTTTSVNLSYQLAAMGRRTLLIDMDQQAHSSEVYLSQEEGAVYKHNITDLLRNRSFDIRNAIYPAVVDYDEHYSIVENLDVIPSHIGLAKVELELVGRTRAETILQKALKMVEDDYDEVIIDCPPALGLIAFNTAVAADSFIIPIEPDKRALYGFSDLLATLYDAKELDPEGEITPNFIILRNNFDKREHKMIEFTENELKEHRKFVLSTIVRKNSHIPQAYAMNLPITLASPKSAGAVDTKALAEELLARDSISFKNDDRVEQENVTAEKLTAVGEV